MDDGQSNAPWQYEPSDGSTPQDGQQPADASSATSLPEPLLSETHDSISWTASEFIAHDKETSWYLALASISLAAAAVVYLIARDIISSVVIVVAAAALGVYGGRQPRQLKYKLDETGLTVGARHLPYSAFRSFAVMDEGAFTSITFLPLKRFGQLMTIYYEPKDEQAIIKILNERLPIEARQHDMVDRFMKKIGFLAVANSGFGPFWPRLCVPMLTYFYVRCASVLDSEPNCTQASRSLISILE